MREIIARIVCLLTVVAIVLLALRFAAVHNPRPVHPVTSRPNGVIEPTPGAPWPETSPALIARGRAVYDELGCASCHSIGGEGNPRRPLDGVGKRVPAAELEGWIGGTGRAVEQLSAGTLRRKRAFQAVSPGDREALVQFLLTLPPRKGD